MTETIKRLWRRVMPHRHRKTNALYHLLYEAPFAEQDKFFKTVIRKADEDQLALSKKYDELMAKQR